MTSYQRTLKLSPKNALKHTSNTFRNFQYFFDHSITLFTYGLCPQRKEEELFQARLAKPLATEFEHRASSYLKKDTLGTITV